MNSVRKISDHTLIVIFMPFILYGDWDFVWSTHLEIRVIHVCIQAKTHELLSNNSQKERECVKQILPVDLCLLTCSALCCQATGASRSIGDRGRTMITDGLITLEDCKQPRCISKCNESVGGSRFC